MDDAPNNNLQKPRSGCAPGGCLGMVVGLGAGILWGQIWVPPEAASADSMDVGFGLMGLVLFGILGGGFLGAIIGAFFNRK